MYPSLLHLRPLLSVALLLAISVTATPQWASADTLHSPALTSDSDSVGWRPYSRLGWIYEMGSGWVWSPRMGVLYSDYFPWVFHQRLGWIATIGESEESSFYYSHAYGWIFAPPDSGSLMQVLSVDRWVDMQYSGKLRKGTVESPIRILPVGDSITSWNGSYRAPLQQMLKGDDYHFDFVGTQADVAQANHDGDHEGYSGNRIEQVYRILFGNPDAWGGPTEGNRIVHESQPDLILVLLGTNDLRQGLWPYAPGPGAKDIIGIYRNMLQDMNAVVPNARIIVCGLARNLTGDMADGEPVAQLIEPFNAALAVMVGELEAELLPVSYVDCYDALQPEHISDGIHPTTEGFRRLADVFFQGIREVTE